MSERGPENGSQLTLAGKLALIARLAYVRSRFLMLLAVLGLVLGNWDLLRSWTDRLFDRIGGIDSAAYAIAPDAEFFCPMCPGVVTRWPEKCPVCKMPLVRRKKGDPGIIPSGVTARMQLSPYRIQLAGIQTAEALYRPLAVPIHGNGRIVSTDPVVIAQIAISRFDASFLRAGQAVELRTLEGEPSSKWSAKITEIGKPADRPTGDITLSAESIDKVGGMQVGEHCVAVIASRVADRTPFSEIPHGTPPPAAADASAIYVCPDHSEYFYLHEGRCPFDENELVANPLADDQRVHWWCPAHPENRSLAAGGHCSQCEGSELIPRVETYWPEGKVLSVPESALLESAAGTLLFVESAPGMFDGRLVEVGPRVDGFASIASGLSVGEKVVASSAFLLDAETRLNPAVASAYFGAGGSTQSTSASSQASGSESELRLERFTMSARDRALAAMQRTCPVTRLPLGSMGAPIPIVLPERTVFLCCEACRPRLPERTRAMVQSRRAP